MTKETLLLIDDDPTMLDILEGTLTGAGLDCIRSDDGEEALSWIVERRDIAVVLSDIFMPGLSGLQLVRRINRLELDRPIPRVLFLTAQPSLEAAVDALRLGARDFLVKPIRPRELIGAVERALGQARQDRALQKERPPQIEYLVRQAEELVTRLRGLAYHSSVSHSGEKIGYPGMGGLESAADRGSATVERPCEPRAATSPGASSSLDTAQAASRAPAPTEFSVLETIEHLRRLRNRYEQCDLDDVAWDMLFELLRAERMRQRLSVSGLAISIRGVSATTSLRRVNDLTVRGFIARVPDPADARRDFVALTPKANDLLTDYLTHANAYLNTLIAPRACPAS